MRGNKVRQGADILRWITAGLLMESVFGIAVWQIWLGLFVTFSLLAYDWRGATWKDWRRLIPRRPGTAEVTTVLMSDNGGAAQRVRVAPGSVVVEFPVFFEATEGTLMVSSGRRHRLIFEDEERWHDNGNGFYHSRWSIDDDHPITFAAELVTHRVVHTRRFDKTTATVDSNRDLLE